MKYKVLKADSPINEQQLEEMASQGWSLVAILQWRRSFYFYFAHLAA